MGVGVARRTGLSVGVAVGLGVGVARRTGLSVGVAVGLDVGVGVDATTVKFGLCWARAVALIARSTVGVAVAGVFEGDGDGGENIPITMKPPSTTARMMSQAFLRV